MDFSFGTHVLTSKVVKGASLIRFQCCLADYFGRQANMDYSAHWAIHAIPGLLMIIMIYDIICQFYIHLFARFANSSFLSMPDNITLLFAIGQFHVHGHQGSCFARFSLNFLQGGGIQDGETMEPLWRPLNKIADSTRGMGTASRQECIDDHMNDSNWCKLTQMSAYV